MTATQFHAAARRFWYRPRRQSGALEASSARPLRRPILVPFALGSIEQLECRSLLSTLTISDSIAGEALANEVMAGEPMAFPQVDVAPQARSSPYGLSPAEVRQAYGFDQITFGGGIVGDGAGQTIAIIDAHDAPNVFSDLQVFNRTFGLPDPPSFRKAVQTDDAGNPPTYDEGWAQEIALDVQWAHAMAPQADILLVEANTAYVSDLREVVDWTRRQPDVSVISMSYGSADAAWNTTEDVYYTTPEGHAGVTFVAASGDFSDPIYPALSPNVLAVGGTRLEVTEQGYGGESAWSGSGGGLSAFQPQPDYQLSVQQSGFRSAPDVAYDADPQSGFSVYDSLSGGWLKIGGTSAGAPQWAALVAIANQGRALAGLPTLDGVNAALYSLPSSAFHDVTEGSNGHDAMAGYDMATGRGTPYADRVVRHLLDPALAVAPGPSNGTPDDQPLSSAPTLPAGQAMVYRVYNVHAAVHLFTTSLEEYQTLVSRGWQDETTGRPAFAVSATAEDGTLPVHRMYNPNNGQHYLTASDWERSALVRAGWKYELDEGYVYTSATNGATEIYRLYNRMTGEHLYTALYSEAAEIISTFPGIWEQQNSLGFGYLVSSEVTTPSAADSDLSGMIAAATPGGDQTIPPRSDAAQADSKAMAGLIATNSAVWSGSENSRATPAPSPPTARRPGHSQSQGEVFDVVWQDLSLEYSL